MPTLTLPTIIAREAQPYVSIRRDVVIPFQAEIEATLPRLFGWAEQKYIEPSGPMFFAYSRIKMPELTVDFGLPTPSLEKGEGDIAAGILPEGNYATLTFWGHYDKLEEVTAVLIGWARQKGIAWDVEERDDGDHFACRLEIYNTDPQEESDPEKWETVLAFKIRD